MLLEQSWVNSRPFGKKWQRFGLRRLVWYKFLHHRGFISLWPLKNYYLTFWLISGIWVVIVPKKACIIDICLDFHHISAIWRWYWPLLEEIPPFRCAICKKINDIWDLVSAIWKLISDWNVPYRRLKCDKRAFYNEDCGGYEPSMRPIWIDIDVKWL